jgi:hypothetical protein
MLRFVAALICVATLAAPAASADGSPGVPTYRDGQLQAHPPGLVQLANGDAWPLTETADQLLSQLLDTGVLKIGDLIRLVFDQASGKVKDVKPLDEQAPARGRDPPRPEPGRAKWEELVKSLKHNELILVDGSKYAFDFYQNGELVCSVLPLGTKKASAFFSLSKVKELRRLEASEAPAEGPVQPGKGAALAPKPGHWYNIDGVVGYVEYIDDAKIGLHTKDGLREIPRASINDIQEIPPPPLEMGAGPTAQPTTGPLSEMVAIEHDQGKLDFVAKSWTFHGTVRHAASGKILLGARAECEAAGVGRLQTGADERRIVTAMGAGLPLDISGTFTFLGDQYYVLRSPPDLVIALISDVPQRETITLPPVLAGVPESFEWQSRVLNPHDVEIHLLEPRLLVPASDPRAQGALIRAYDGNEAHREAALRAIATSNQPGFLPFLLYELYLEQGSGAELRRAFGAFGKAGEDWLLGFFHDLGSSDEAASVEIAVPTAGGKVEKKKIGEPPRLVARALELLSAVASDRTSDRVFGMALPFTRKKNEELRSAARALFVDHPERSIPFMLRRLRSEPEVQSILLEIDEAKPGTLRDLASRHCKPDAQFDQSIAGLPESDARKKLVERLRRDLSGEAESALNVDSDIFTAREAIARIKNVGSELQALRVDVAKACVTAMLRAPEAKEVERYRRAELLRRAILFDTKDELARHELSLIYEESAREAMQSAAVRTGPDSTYRQLRVVHAGDTLPRVPYERGEREPPKGWAAVGLSDGRTGYVAMDLVRDQGATLVVDKEARPRAVASALLLAARVLDPERAHEIDRTIADVRAGEAAEAGELGDWTHAVDLYREALSRAPSARFRWAVLAAFLRANPLAPVLATLFVLMIAGGFVLPKPKPAAKKKPAPTSTAAAAPKEARLATKKVPS